MMMDGRVEKWLLNLGWTGRSRLSHPVCQVYERRSLGSANAFRGSRRTSQCALKTLKKCQAQSIRDDTRATSTSPFQIQKPLFNSSVHHHAGHVPPLDASSFNGQRCFSTIFAPKLVYCALLTHRGRWVLDSLGEKGSLTSIFKRRRHLARSPKVVVVVAKARARFYGCIYYIRD